MLHIGTVIEKDRHGYSIKFNDGAETIPIPYNRWDPYVSGERGNLSIKPRIGDEVLTITDDYGEKVILGTMFDSAQRHSLTPQRGFIQKVWATAKVKDNNDLYYWSNAVSANAIFRTLTSFITLPNQQRNPPLDYNDQQVPISLNLFNESVIGQDEFSVSSENEDGERLIIQFTRDKINIIRVRKEDKFQGDGWLCADSLILGSIATFFTPPIPNRPTTFTGLNSIQSFIPLPLISIVEQGLATAEIALGNIISIFLAPLAAAGVPPFVLGGIAHMMANDIIWGTLYGLLSDHTHDIFPLPIEDTPFRFFWRE